MQESHPCDNGLFIVRTGRTAGVESPHVGLSCRCGGRPEKYFCEKPVDLVEGCAM